MQIITKNYVPPSVTAKKSPFATSAATINKFWKNIGSGLAKAQLFIIQALKKSSWIFWLTGIVGIVFTAIILHKPGLEITAVMAPVNQDVADLVKKAKQFVKQGQVEKALPLYLQLANQGNADAQFNVGLIYANGQGIAKDDKQAVDWFSKAANQGHREAQTKLGFMYATGKGVEQNYNSAVYWCYKAAEQGDVIAQYNLGQMYAKGQGVAKDNSLAVSWFSKAAAQGDAHAQYSLGNMYTDGVGVAKDIAQAEDWYRKAAKQGLGEAVTALKKMDK
ncbi:MAG TPA: tetratricopeptide repeat protein [Methylobacter sp.]